MMIMLMIICTSDSHDHDHSDWRSFVPQMLANCNYAITLGKQMGFSLVGISGVAHHVLIIILSFLMPWAETF